MQGDDEWTGTLTDLDPTLAGADTLATFNPYSEGGRPGMRKAELPFMKDWQDRQATARSHYSTGSSLSLASHVIPEAFRKLDMTKLTVLPSLAEHHILDAPTSPPSAASPQDGGGGATGRTWLDSALDDLQSLGTLGPTLSSGVRSVTGVTGPWEGAGAGMHEGASAAGGSLDVPYDGPQSFFPSANEPGSLRESLIPLPQEPAAESKRASVSFAAAAGDGSGSTDQAPAAAQDGVARKIQFSRRNT